LTFQAEEAITGDPIILDSIYVKNLDKECDTTVYGDSPSLLIYLISGLVGSSDSQFTSNLFPNPFHKNTQLILSTIHSKEITIVLSDFQGKPLYSSYVEITPGSHRFLISTSERISLLTVQGNHDKATFTLVNQSPVGFNTNRWEFCEVFI